MKLEAKTRLLALAQGHQFFVPQLVKDATRVEYKSREKLVSMPIREFLKLAKPGQAQYKADAITELLMEGKQFNTLPFLIFDVEGDEAFVTGHEGRHRARALLDLGCKTMPVILKGPIRWSEQTDPDRFDYVETWPEVLWSETRSDYFPFPVSREDAAKPYTP